MIANFTLICATLRMNEWIVNWWNYGAGYKIIWLEGGA